MTLTSFDDLTDNLNACGSLWCYHMIIMNLTTTDGRRLAMIASFHSCDCDINFLTSYCHLTPTHSNSPPQKVLPSTMAWNQGPDWKSSSSYIGSVLRELRKNKPIWNTLGWGLGGVLFSGKIDAFYSFLRSLHYPHIWRKVRSKQKRDCSRGDTSQMANWKYRKAMNDFWKRLFCSALCSLYLLHLTISRICNCMIRLSQQLHWSHWSEAALSET